MEGKTAEFCSEAQTEQDLQFGADADTYIDKKQDKILIACNVSQWDLNNSSRYLT